jgi:hypothetical protein
MSQSQSEPEPLGSKPFIPPDNKPEYFLSTSRGACVTVVDFRATFFTLTFHSGKTARIPAGKSGLYLSCQIFFRHRNRQELMKICSFQEN